MASAGGQLNLKLVDLFDRPLQDPEVEIQVRYDDWRAVPDMPVICRPTDDGMLVVPDLPAGKLLTGKVSPSLHHERHLPALWFTPGEDDMPPHELCFVKRLKKWGATFTAWHQLSSGSFGHLKEVLETSQALRFGPAKSESVFPNGFTRRDYEGIISGGARSQVLALAALLNIHFKMRMINPVSDDTERSWFSYVRRLIKVRRDRIIAEVDSGMADSIRKIYREIHNFGDYRTERASHHWGNMHGEPYSVSQASMVSIKSREKRGNLQLTVGRAIRNGEGVTLLDADIDEKGTWWAHAREVAKNWLTGNRTHPFVIHELLSYKTPEGIGYELRPRGSRG